VARHAQTVSVCSLHCGHIVRSERAILRCLSDASKRSLVNGTAGVVVRSRVTLCVHQVSRSLQGRRLRALLRLHQKKSPPGLAGSRQALRMIEQAFLERPADRFGRRILSPPPRQQIVD
jgi:hypothetical protein